MSASLQQEIRWSCYDALQDALREKSSFCWIDNRMEEPRLRYRS